MASLGDPLGGSEPLIDSTLGGSSSDAVSASRGKRTANTFGNIMSKMSGPAFERGVNALAKLISNIATQKPGEAGGGGDGNTQSRMAAAVARTQNLVSSGGFQNFAGGLLGSAQATGAAGGAGNAVGAVMNIGSMGMGAIDQRTNAMYGKALSYDKLSVLYQQTHAISQQQFSKNFIQPLMQYRLGQGGAATLLGLQAQTGLLAQQNAAGISGLQAATGYMYNTQDMAKMMTTLASPTVNNRMTMTLGTGMYGPGGQQRSLMQVVQQIVRGSGLTNEAIIKSGMQIGSVTRAKLSALGVPEDMQNMILQYAQENVNFQRKGGRGMYDPSRASDRKLMGIEANFATQQQETMRASEQRDANFYKKQSDNYAQLEENTQGLIRAFGALEEKLSGIIGTRISTRNKAAISMGKLAGGIGLAGAGILAGFIPGLQPLAPALTIAGAGLAAGSLNQFGGGGIGDPMPQDEGMRTYETAPQRVSVDQRKSLSKLNPQFRSRIQRMMRDNPNISLAEGHRDGMKQRSLFLSRYSKTSEKTGIFWEGSYWKKNPGVADAAPPGASMHEVGLAADLAGDLNWVQQNAARYGLKTFGGVNGEPWHIQPAELPNDRVTYEKMGARWGLNGALPMDKRTRISGLSSGGVRAAGISGGLEKGKGTGSSATTPPDVTEEERKYWKSPEYLSPRTMANLLWKHGFRGADLEAMMGIALRETHNKKGRFNRYAFNPTGRDMSFGLFQINMKDDDPRNPGMGKARMARFGISRLEQLFDADTNVRAARILWEDSKKKGNGNPFRPWLGRDNAWALGKIAHNGTKDKRVDDYATGKRLLDEAGYVRLQNGGWAPPTRQKGSAGPKTGDPMPPQTVGASSVGGNVRIDTGGITIAPHFTIMGGGAGVDTHKVAQEAARIIERDLKLALMRKN